MTTGTTASGSENWETYSDASEMEPERDIRDGYYTKGHAHASTTNALGMNHNLNGKRPMTAGGGGPATAGQMAPPPPKIRMHNQHQHPHQHHAFQAHQYAHGQFRDISDENLHTNVHGAGLGIEGSDAAWSTELEETY
jgi:hypothetical protein